MFLQAATAGWCNGQGAAAAHPFDPFQLEAALR
jgi:hypothetical protein